AHAKRISAVSNEYRKATMRTLRVAFLSSFALDFFSSLSIAFVAVGLGFRLIEGSVLLLPALTILLLAPEYFTPIKAIGKDYHATLDGQVAMNEINGILMRQPITDESLDRDKINLEIIETIRLDNINVKLEERDILQNINFKVQKGMIGVIGASGAGKTTLIHLLAGRLSSESGTVIINNVPFTTLHAEWWFEQIAYIPQHPYIFPLSLADNIRFYDPEASDEKVEAIVERIGLSSIVKSFPKGIHEKI